MKLLLLSTVVCATLFAFNAEVKKGDVTLQINKDIKSYTKGNNVPLKSGDIVCFVEGNGRVVIKGENYKKQLSKRSRSCKVIPNSKGNSNTYTKDLEKVGENIIIALSNTQEDEITGVSRKSVEQETSTQEFISISKEKLFIAVASSKWGPLPIVLEVFDTKGALVDTLINEDDTETLFILPVNRVEDGYKIKVTNMFEDILFNPTVKFE